MTAGTKELNVKAATYVRVNSEEQVDGFSLDAQRRAITEFCQARGWDITHQYADEGKSAWVESAAKRQAFNQMLTDAANGEFDVVVTHSLDRLSRNLMVTLNAFHTFSSNGVTYVSATQEIDDSTPEGKLFMTMVAAFAQYFSDSLSGHTRKGMRERSAAGTVQRRPALRLPALRSRLPGNQRRAPGLPYRPGSRPAGPVPVRKVRLRVPLNVYPGR